MKATINKRIRHLKIEFGSRVYISLDRERHAGEYVSEASIYNGKKKIQKVPLILNVRKLERSLNSDLSLTTHPYVPRHLEETREICLHISPRGYRALKQKGTTLTATHTHLFERIDVTRT